MAQVDPGDEPLINSASEDDRDDDGHNDDHHGLSRRWQQVEDAMGNTAGTVEPHNVFKVDLPRTDISATIADITVEPDFALDGHVTFQRWRDREVMKFEVVLLDAEVNPVLSALFAEDLKPELEVFTALHNHYLFDSPQIRFMHGFAVGNAADMAAALYRALSENSGEPFGHGDEPPGDPGRDAQRVADIIGGDEELTNKNEVDPVARELRKRGFLVTALHNHELDIDPHLYYMHAWNTGDPTMLARDIRAALELTDSKFK